MILWRTQLREIEEEYCTDVLEFEFLGFRDVHRVHHGKKTHWVTLDFKVLINPKLVKNGEPHKFTKVAFFQLDKLPPALHSQLPNFLNLYKEKL